MSDLHLRRIVFAEAVTYRTHMMNTLKPETGTLTPLNTSANLSIPRPLLVVHSGKTTTGPFARLRISSNVCGALLRLAEAIGSRPVCCSIARNDASRNPTIAVRALGVFAGDEIAAEPVPVRRPGVRAGGVEGAEDCREKASESYTGMRNTGLNLRHAALSARMWTRFAVKRRT